VFVDVGRKVLHEGQDVGAATFDERDGCKDDQSGKDHLRSGHIDQVRVVDLIVRRIRFPLFLCLNVDNLFLVKFLSKSCFIKISKVNVCFHSYGPFLILVLK
jgi:hypothetical protein